MFKLIAPALLIGTLALTGCTVPEEPDSHSNQGQTMQEAPVKESTKKKDAPVKPKWVGHMDEVHIGMMQSEVKSILGKPDDTDSSEMELPDFDVNTGESSSKTTVMDNWTYGDMFSDTDGDDVWMLSFTDGKLDSKSRI